MDLILLPEILAVARYAPGAAGPRPPDEDHFWAEIRTADSLTVVGDLGSLSQAEAVETGWRALMVQGPLDFSLVGVLASLLDPLKSAGVSVFVLSSFETDFVLVRATALPKALAALAAAGHSIQGD